MGTPKKTRTKRGGPPSLFKMVMFALVVAAVTKELQKDPEDREWHGTVAGFVPYEFRVPTLQRIKERVWDPAGEHFLSPHVFGVGWTVNVGRIVAVVREKVTD
ncbi:hypothetical protein GCM10009718_15280 [Isoptericola halotolerans]|uniref:DUF5808 domain-containing protein n=1 Tax=Isoptericola halotolerans TaxID=300560 RepID=A0ABX2A1S3_9MICO|nr:DUF5808 domain-containing protein [Isoptericola halotolerans]NOV95551.1 hypothetical protein [Isoptericola halotolerans]